MLAYEEEEIQNNKKMIEKHEEKIWSNWKRLIKVMLIRERLKLKYNDNEVVHSTKNDSDKHMSTDDERDDEKTKSKPPIAENKAAKSKSIIKKVSKAARKIKKKDEESESDSDDEHAKKSRKNSRKKAAKPKETIKVKNATTNIIDPIVVLPETLHNEDLMLSENDDDN